MRPSLEQWLAERSYHHSAFPPARLAAEREASVSVCLPARETAETIGPILEVVLGLADQGVVDQVVVVDAGSQDGTADVAARAGAEVHQQSDLLPEFGPVLGKGDAMWRALTVLSGDMVCFLDSDSEAADFGAHFVCGLLGPLLCDPGVHFVKGAYRRPFRAGETVMEEGGGRVNELTARPLLNLFYPELAGFRQPLAGEMAARREVLERLSFSTGYAVEIGMLIDAWRAVGLDGLAQTDIGVRQNRHQPLGSLVPMAYEVLRAVALRLEREGRLDELEPGTLVLPAADQSSEIEIEIAERPPLASLAAAERA